MTTTAFNLSTGNLTQDWSNAGLITANNDWSGVASITGYRGDGLAGATGVDPRTITAAASSAVVINVIANQTNPNTLTTGGVAEFDSLANHVVALQGSGTARAPSLVCYLDATGRQDINFSCNLRDVDGSADNALQPIAVQYRVGGGNWTNVFYVADASTGPNLATAVTPVNVTLGADANNSATLEIRVLTTDAVGSDEWIGIDDIVVSSIAAGADTTPPALAAVNPTTPGDNSVGVDAAANLTLRFTEAVQGVTGNVVIDDGQGDVRTIAITDGTQISFAGSTLTVNPLADLLAGHHYDVTIAGGVIADAAGNAFAGIAAGGFDFTIANPAQLLTIGAIQGLGHMSQYNGIAVRTQGVVTAIDTNGYYVQSATGATDGDVRTSDAIFIFTGSAPTGVARGDLLQLDGTVSEFKPGAANSNNLTTTELINTTVLHLGTGTFDEVILGHGHLVAPNAITDNDQFGVYDPAQDGIDFYESLEGMYVTVDTPLVVATTRSDGQAFIVASLGIDATGLNANGGLTISATDDNPERLQLFLDSGLFAGTVPQLSVGDQLASVRGIISYGGGSYDLSVTEAVTRTLDVTAPREITTLVGDLTHLTLADYNLNNFGFDDSQAKVDSLARDIVLNLRSPDIIGAQEVQDNDGIGTGSDLRGNLTAGRLIAAIDALGGPHYSYIEVAPTATNISGGEPNGNIRNAYFYNAARVDYVAGSAQALTDPVFNGTRKPLAADFLFNGQGVHLIDVHSTSRGGSEAQFGAHQPPSNAGDSARTAQATAVANYVQGLESADPSAKIVVQGDFNGFTWEPAVQALLAKGLTDLADLLPAQERYSYVFDGNSQELDHLLASGSFVAGASFDAVHLNAELSDTAQLSSDHDPLLALLDFSVTITGTADGDTLNGGAPAETINGLGGNDIINGNGGNDTIDGGAGDDSIRGGAGADTLTGGAGNDRFIFRPGEAQGDIILDFDGKGAALGDTLVFQGYARGAYLSHVGNTYQVHSGAAVETFTLNPTTLHASDVVFQGVPAAAVSMMPKAIDTMHVMIA